MGTGLILTLVSLWQMSHFSLLMGEQAVVVSGLLQGFGMGLIYVPLSTVTFMSLAADMRSEGTAFFSLLRNVGSSIGISVVQIMFTRNLQTVHTDLSAHVTALHFAGASPAALVALNHEISRQAAMVAYVDDFWLMLILSIGAVPLMLVFRSPKNEAGRRHACHAGGLRSQAMPARALLVVLLLLTGCMQGTDFIPPDRPSVTAYGSATTGRWQARSGWYPAPICRTTGGSFSRCRCSTG
jgi:hypothetical protein